MRIREEAEAVEQIFRLIRVGKLVWVSSIALLAEVGRDPDLQRRGDMEALLSMATETIQLTPSVAERSVAFELAGYGAFDALHLSFAEAGQVDALLTTDDRFANRAGRGAASPRVLVLNPVKWLKGMVL